MIRAVADGAAAPGAPGARRGATRDGSGRRNEAGGGPASDGPDREVGA